MCVMIQNALNHKKYLFKKMLKAIQIILVKVDHKIC